MKARKKRYCLRCNTQVVRENVRMEGNYPWYCPYCDENMFNFEVYKTQKKVKIKKLAIKN